MKRQYKSDYFGTRVFCKLDKPIILSKKLGISLINYDVKKSGYGYFKIADDVGYDDLDAYSDDYEQIKEQYKNDKELVEKMSFELFNKKIESTDLDTYESYREYILSTSLVVKFDKKYEERITYEHKKVILPDEKRENEVFNYIHFINFLMPYNELLDQRTYASVDFRNMIDDIPALFLQRFLIIDDNRKTTNLKPFKYISKTFVNIIKNYNNDSYHIKEFEKAGMLNEFKKEKDRIINIAAQLEKLFDDPPFYEIFNFIANAIYVAFNSYDHRTSILIYSSVLESILTHKPDYNRFNVEDSISKQFALKTCIILEKENKEYDMDKYVKRCNFFYSIRSDIAHGNADNYDERIKRFDKLYKTKEEFKDVKTTYDSLLETVRDELRNILYHVLNYYLKDKKYIDFIKNN